ncbi:helix-turn-helix domain-containing protein [Caballeronia novacaledonica]|uniref:IclR family transcriptional regulator domain-containing protein n=1 Tax=Caballeronia novacaledonica TaxID=1544861 RepID=UPI001EE22ACE|nr:IclR family transcriptional regulator C-terminal domain-containing protein [Caballeronia novacaledonica]GJH08364.1 helix-turn-helix domain-containing protein [Caballeronia novacaledonica]
MMSTFSGYQKPFYGWKIRRKSWTIASMANPDTDGFIRSFARGLSVIEAMGRSGTHTVATVSTATNLPRTVVRRILLTLCELGFAAESEEKGFRLTPKVLNLGMTYLTSLPFWGHAQRALENLCVQTGESCALAVFDGNEVVYVLRIPSPKIMSLSLGMGSRLPAFATAPGRALLAFQDQQFLDRYIGEVELKAFTPSTVDSKSSLIAELDLVLRDGYAWVDKEFDRHICGLAVPVRDEHRNVVAAISTNILSDETSRERAIKDILPALRAAAEQLSGLAPAFLGPANRPASRANGTAAARS